ncbi:MAG: hypothetical protein ACXIUV_15535 [Alkalilacustris sp.]
MGLVFLGTAIGLTGMVMALFVGHPVWLALLMVPAFGSGSVLLLAASMSLRRRPRREASPVRVHRTI